MMELGRTRTFRTGLALVALVVATAALGLALLASEPKIPEIPAPAPRIQRATEQEMERAWENLVDAIQREDQVEALRIAEWLDEQRGFEAHVIIITKIVQDWCALNGQESDFCKEEDSETE